MLRLSSRPAGDPKTALIVVKVPKKPIWIFHFDTAFKPDTLFSWFVKANLDYFRFGGLPVRMSLTKEN